MTEEEFKARSDDFIWRVLGVAKTSLDDAYKMIDDVEGEGWYGSENIAILREEAEHYARTGYAVGGSN